jgi:hypothetical protein
MGLSTHTDGAGRFTLTAVPALQSFTVDALGNPGTASPVSRSNVLVQPGQTLDIGNLDLPVCPQPAHDDVRSIEQQQYPQDAQDSRD